MSSHKSDVRKLLAEEAKPLTYRNAMLQEKAADLIVPRCLIGIEAGMATHYVARELGALGHDVKQVPPVIYKHCTGCDLARSGNERL